MDGTDGRTDGKNQPKVAQKVLADLKMRGKGKKNVREIEVVIRGLAFPRRTPAFQTMVLRNK